MTDSALTPRQYSGADPLILEVKDDGTMLVLRWRDEGRPVVRIGVVGTAVTLSGPALLQVAALCLHNQPFGFTREDVRRHRSSAAHLRDSLERQGPIATWDFPLEEMESKRAHADWHENIADRIEALLSPEDA